MKECEALATPEFRWNLNHESGIGGFDVLLKTGMFGLFVKI